MWTKKKYRKLTCKEDKNLGHHNFEPRYDSKFPNGFMQSVIEMCGDPRRYMEQLYVQDICTYCGEVRRRRSRG